MALSYDKKTSNELDFLLFFIMFLLTCFCSEMHANRLCGDQLVTDLLTANVKNKTIPPTEPAAN